MTSPQSPYHVLRRLLSICYNSPLETASFYANLLHDLFADDLLKGIELDVRCLDLGARYIAEDASLAKKGKAGTTSKGKGKSKPEFNHRTLHNSAAGPSHILPNGLRIADHDIHIKKLKVHSHLVIHLQAWIHIAAKDYYSAIHLVRDKVYRPTTISRKGKEKADGLKGRGANHDTAFLPFDGNREQAERNHHSCLECALIMAEACQQLGRFEEGRSILRNVHEATARANRNLGLSLTFAKPVSFPASSALRLAQLSAQANHERMEKITSTISAAERDKRQPDAIKYFEIALLDDPWLWEAWRGICDFGGHAQALAPFSDENVDLPLLPFPTDLLLGVKDIPELNTNRTSQSGRPHSEDMARSPSIPSSPPEYPSNASSATTATSTSGVRRMSPLPSASPAAKAALLGMTHTAAPPGMDPKTLPRAGSYATPVATTNVEPQPPHQHHIGKRMSRGPPPMQSKSRGYGRLSPSIDDMSFPDLTFSQSDSAVPTSLFAAAAAGEYRTTASVSHPLELPSIASRLFPSARPLTSVSTPEVSSMAYEPGVGKPPISKRPRNGNMFAMNPTQASGSGTGAATGRSTLSRNATGRNASGHGLAERYESMESERAVRRSSRIKGSQAPAEPSLTPELFHKIPDNRSNQRLDMDISPMNGGVSDKLSPGAAFEAHQQRTADLWLLRIVQRCAAAYNDACNYNCKTAISILNTLPAQVKRGSWATSLYAKCFYELADYRTANTFYEHLRAIEPYRLEGMEWYSTVLWHLEDRAGLSVLAQQLMAVSRDAAEPWMAAGNGFALQGEHEEALRCFKRASAIRPDKAYTYTLAAYEALEMDEYDRAIAHYQLAVRADVRHYHAWFGLGRVYQKMGKTRFAEYHFRRALEINPSNVVLYCCVGTIVEKRGDMQKALDLYEKALEITPTNKMARFRQARVMIGMKRYAKALPLLEDLSKTCSNEASVMFLLGKLYRLMGNREKAMCAFTYARDLHPKLANAISSVMATGEDGDGNEEAEAEAMREGL